MNAAKLTYVSIFIRDVETLPSFCAKMFGLEEVAASRSSRYRELDMGAAIARLSIGRRLCDALDERPGRADGHALDFDLRGR
jgi:hypothetical protein